MGMLFTLLKDCDCFVQPLQSINVAQERSAEQETTQPANSAQPAPAAEVEPKPAAPPLAANAFSMEGRAGMLPLPAYSMMQQLHLQVMQAQALQAQQLGVGFPAQQQQQPVPNGVALADSEQMSAFLASNPVAYQQLLATMAASQGLRLTPNSTAIAPPAARPSQPAMAAAPGYGMQAAPLFQFPQGMPGMPTPSDLSHLQALGAQSGVTHPPADHQQLGLHQGPSSLRNDMPMDLSRHPSIMSTTVDSMPGFPLQQPPSAGIYSPMAFQGTSPGMWGWGTLGTDGHAGGAAPDTAAPSPFANPQLQSRPGSASVPSVPMTGPQFGGMFCHAMQHI